MCDDYGKEKLVEDCALYQPPNPLANAITSTFSKEMSSRVPSPRSSLPKNVEKKVDQYVEPFHIPLNCLSKRKSVSVSAKIDSKTNHSVMSNEVWVKVIILEQPMYCTFYVANLGENNKHAILGWFWMCCTPIAKLTRKPIHTPYR